MTNPVMTTAAAMVTVRSRDLGSENTYVIVARVGLVPIADAVLLSIMLAPLMQFLEKLHVPTPLASANVGGRVRRRG